MKFLKSIFFCLCFISLALTTSAYAQNFDSIPVEEPQTASVSAGNKSKECGDDERLSDIVKYMETTEAVEPRLTLTAETYLALDIEVRQALYGKILICPDNIVLKSGKTIKKIEINFNTLLDNIMQAVTAENYEEVKRLATTFTIKPAEPKEITSYFTPVPIEKEKQKKLASALGIEQPNFSGYPDKPVRVVDIFIGLNGKTTKPADIYIVSSAHAVKKLGKSTLYVISSDTEGMIYKLNRLGLNSILDN